MGISKYDVIIAGASFAGLAVASRIKSGKVLLISPEEVGENCKSACGTILEMMKDLGFEEAVLQVHRKIILHLSRGNLVYFLKKPFCVFDSHKLLWGLSKIGNAEKLKARVEDFDGKVVKTDKGNFQARIFVDASGPKSGNHLSFGLETIVEYQEEGLHFWYEPKIFPKGIFWLFPQGKTSRFGVGSYQGETNLKPYLDDFLARFGLKADKFHGGYFPHRLGKPVEGEIFRVGDAAGQCLPITGEGIRPAIFFGQKCGEIIESVLSKKISLEQGLGLYQKFVLKRKIFYEALYRLQNFLISLHEGLFYPLSWLVSKKPVTSFVLHNYLKILKDE